MADDSLRTAANDLALLRAFEPVVRFTQGEYFFPVSVHNYVQHAALWTDLPGGESVIEASAETFDSAVLARVEESIPGQATSLSGIMTGNESPRVRIPLKDRPPRLRGASRLAAVGLLGRLIDALNRLSLIFRGSVPGGSAAKSFLLQQAHLEPDRPAYYGRVVRDGDWLICQYWFFYSFNNWRSGFGGVNEHESDWEQVTIFLDGTGELDDAGLPAPRWVVFSAHDETGDDLRRRWDDPDLTLVDARHPVVFAGAGSHSGAYLPGDYLISIEPPTQSGFLRVGRWLARVFTPWSTGAQNVGIPYVDYARGDGRSIGPGQGDPWYPEVIDDDTPWVRGFRGLWGHDTRDRLGGERGPAGPRYERDGTVRASWAAPVGWAGLAKVAANPAVESDLLDRRREQLHERLAELEDDINSTGDQLRVTAAGRYPGSREVRALAGEEARLLSMRREQTRLRDEAALMALDASTASADPHAHLSHRNTPIESATGTRARLLSWWAVLSTPLILWTLGQIIHPAIGISETEMSIVGLVVLVSIEGFARGKFLAVVG
ncbi:MAG TPA: hypothetical protein VLQ92_05530, partial [Candidatus Limnocylindrales bacterium]|nr:hypothetical protein [Candidatus Limnocylindrales bacterium]